MTNTVLNSASRIVFIVMALGAVGGFFTGRLDQGNFMILCGSAFAFYFTTKSGPNDPGSGLLGSK